MTPKVYSDRRHVYHLYVIRVKRRDDLVKFLSDRGIQAGIHYPIPVHRLPAYADLGYGPGAFPASEQAAAEVVSLPMYPELTPDMIRKVAEAVREWEGEWGVVNS
jgi:dTDP-4-amino-4,6-dideoxygalactose transaminase